MRTIGWLSKSNLTESICCLPIESSAGERWFERCGGGESGVGRVRRAEERSVVCCALRTLLRIFSPAKQWKNWITEKSPRIWSICVQQGSQTCGPRSSEKLTKHDILNKMYSSFFCHLKMAYLFGTFQKSILPAYPAFFKPKSQLEATCEEMWSYSLLCVALEAQFNISPHWDPRIKGIEGLPHFQFTLANIHRCLRPYYL